MWRMLCALPAEPARPCSSPSVLGPRRSSCPTFPRALMPAGLCVPEGSTAPASPG